MSLHPKTAAAGAGATAGLIVTAILRAVGLDVTPDLAAAISAVLSVLASYLTPSPPPAPIAPQQPELRPGGLQIAGWQEEWVKPNSGSATGSTLPPAEGEHWS